MKRRSHVPGAVAPGQAYVVPVGTYDVARLSRAVAVKPRRWHTLTS